MLKLRLPTTDLSCPLGHTCDKCLLYVQMPVDVPNPITGEQIPATEFDCAYVWGMLGAWDGGRQAYGVHAAVATQTKEDAKFREDLTRVMATGQQALVYMAHLQEQMARHVLSSAGDTHLKLVSGHPESLPSHSKPPTPLHQSSPEPESGERSQDESSVIHQLDGRLSADTVQETREGQTTPGYPNPVGDSDRDPSTPDAQSA